MQKKLFFILLCVLIVGCGRPHQPLNQLTKIDEFFGAVVKVDVCYETRQGEALTKALDEVWARFADIHRRMSVYDKDSDINRINNSYPQSAQVQADTYALIKDSMDYYQISEGVFDISIGPLLSLWKESEKRNSLPTKDEIRQTQAKMGIENIRLLEANRIQLLKEGFKINIDSIGDGFAADEAARILRSHGFKNFLVDASGELFAGGHNCQGRKWRIGVRDPLDSAKIIDVIELSDAAASTSGNHERYYTIQGKHWSHIVNPLTGFPSRDILSATVVAPSAQFADFWSTALCLLDVKKGGVLTESFGDGCASMVVFKDSRDSVKRMESRNYKKFQKRTGLFQ